MIQRGAPPHPRASAVALALVALAACGGRSARPAAPASAGAAAPDQAATPRLVVLLVVDGLPSWSFDEKRRLATAGFARLAREGVTYVAASYPYAATHTGPGHATLVTGAPPSVTGIVANRWFDVAGGRVVDAVEDPDSPMVNLGPPRSAPLVGASPRHLLVPSVGDALLGATGGRARVVAISLKRHAAVLLGGKRPGAAVWYDEELGAFGTSRHYGEAPAWLSRLAAEHPVAPRVAAYEWTPADRAALARATRLPDRAPGELGIFGNGPTFPHRPGQAERPGLAFQATPLSDDLLLEAALAAIDGERMGADDVPDLLLLSFSAHDLVGHGWGQESWESLDQFIRLDRVIGALLDGLDARVGRGRWALVFTSDHGATRVAEQTAGSGGRGRRIDPAEVDAAVKAAARRAIGPGEWIAHTREQLIYLTPAALALPAARRDRLLDAVVAAARGVPDVAVAMRTDGLWPEGGATPTSCDDRVDEAALVCRSVHRPRSGDVWYGPAAGSVLMERPWDTSTHGSTSDDDRRVPLIVVEPGVAPKVVTSPVVMLQVAPTLARQLGVDPPPAAVAPPL